MRGRIIYGIAGAVLAVITLLTGSYGISPVNRESYEMALSLQQQVDELGFSKFSLQDYPVRCYDGSYDYVFTCKNDKVNMDRQSSKLGVMAGTAYEADGIYQILVPTVEKFHDLMSVMGAVSEVKNGTFAFEEQEHGKEEQVVVIWHEATHAWQMTNFEKEILGEDDQEETGDLSIELRKQIDEAPEIVRLYEQEMQMLLKAVLAESIDAKKSYVLKYKEFDDERRDRLSDEILAAEKFYESVEGTACYVEAKVYEMIKGYAAYEKEYLTPIEEYSKGTHKYYSMGMAKCLLLDAVDKDWKEKYDYSVSLTQFLYESYGAGSASHGYLCLQNPRHKAAMR